MKKRVMFYDIETMFMLAYVFGLRDQYVAHNQLHPSNDTIRIICIAYCFNDNKPVKALTWDGTEESYKKMLNDFIKLAKSADIIIGKNSDKFDNKELNTQLWMHNVKPEPQLFSICDDLEVQFRRNFRFPSNALDYVSRIRNLGGKSKMEQDDWKAISNYFMLKQMKTTTNSKKILGGLCQIWFKQSLNAVNKSGSFAWKKMIKYNKKDVLDTKNLWDQCAPYLVSKPSRDLDAAKDRDPCYNCKQRKLVKDGTMLLASSLTHIRYRQKYKCMHCGKKSSGKIEVKARDT